MIESTLPPTLRIVFSLLITALSLECVMAQSTTQVDKDAIITSARKQLVAMSEPAGELNEFALKNNLHGEFVVDFTIIGKGEIVTVFMVSSNPDNIQNQNLIKSKLVDIRFENIKIPKKERIKFRHTLTF